MITIIDSDSIYSSVSSFVYFILIFKCKLIQQRDITMTVSLC